MSRTPAANLPASVRQRLLNLSRERHEDFGLTLIRYASERLLYRLSRSEYSDRFVLKGALLLGIWMGQPYRPTRDIDLLGCGDSSQSALANLFRHLCILDVEPDALTFQPASVQVTEIREEQEYGGQRVQMLALSLCRLSRPSATLSTSTLHGPPADRGRPEEPTNEGQALPYPVAKRLHEAIPPRLA